VSTRDPITGSFGTTGPGERRMTPAITDEVLRRSPTLPPIADADAPSVGTSLSFVFGLLGVAGVIAWLAAPFMA
jgi:hypothetical protein